MTVVVALGCSLLVTAAAQCGWVGIVGTTSAPVVRPQRRRSPVRIAQIAAAITMACVVLVVTRWPVLAVAVAAAIVALPVVVARRRQDDSYAERLEGTRDWLLQLRSLLLAGEAIEQALIATAGMQPDGGTLSEPLRRMRLRLERTSTVAALRGLADDLDNHVADAATVTLVHAVVHGSKDLAKVLAALGEWAREEVTVHDRVEAERQGVRTSRTIILTVFAVMPVTFWATSRDQLAAFGSVLGQLVLSLILLAAGACVLWMSSLLRPQRQPRFLDAGAPS